MPELNHYEKGFIKGYIAMMMSLIIIVYCAACFDYQCGDNKNYQELLLKMGFREGAYDSFLTSLTYISIASFISQVTFLWGLWKKNLLILLLYFATCIAMTLSMIIIAIIKLCEEYWVMFIFAMIFSAVQLYAMYTLNQIFEELLNESNPEVPPQVPEANLDTNV